MSLLLGLTLALTPLVADETYVCRYTRPSHLLAFFAGKTDATARITSIASGASLMPGLVSAEANDASRTIYLRGDQASLDQTLTYLRQVDVPRRRIQAEIRLISPADFLDNRVTTVLKANTPWEMTEVETGIHLKLTVRPNADGTFTSYLEKNGHTSIVFRVKSAEKMRIVWTANGVQAIGPKETPVGDDPRVEISIKDLEETAPSQ